MVNAYSVHTTITMTIRQIRAAAENHIRVDSPDEAKSEHHLWPLKSRFLAPGDTVRMAGYSRRKPSRSFPAGSTRSTVGCSTLSFVSLAGHEARFSVGRRRPWVSI